MKLKCDEALSNSALHFNLRRYIKLAKRGINRLLLPLISLISQFLPTVPLADTARNVKFPNTQREVELDPLTWPSGVKRTRARVAAEYWLGGAVQVDPRFTPDSPQIHPRFTPDLPQIDPGLTAPGFSA